MAKKVKWSYKFVQNIPKFAEELIIFAHIFAEIYKNKFVKNILVETYLGQNVCHRRLEW